MAPYFAVLFYPPPHAVTNCSVYGASCYSRWLVKAMVADDQNK